MGTAVRMLLWELWARNRVLNICALVFLPVWPLLLLVFPDGDESRSLIVNMILRTFHSALMALPAMFYLIYPVVVSARSLEQSTRQGMGFPERLYTLPLPTWVLVTLHMAVCVLLVGIVCAAPALIFRSVPGYWWWNSFVIITGAVCFLAVDWVLASLRPVQVILLFLLIPLLIFCALIPTEGHASPFWVGFFIVLTPVLFVLAWIVAIRGVGAVRHGALIHVPAKDEVYEKLLDLLPQRKSAFRSPVAAQIWYESRWLIPIVYLLLLIHVGSVALVHIEALVNKKSLFEEQIMKAVFFPLIAVVPYLALMLGGALAKSGSIGQSMGFGPFQATRPLGDETFVDAKIKAGVRALATILAVSLTFVLGYLGLYYLTRMTTGRSAGAFVSLSGESWGRFLGSAGLIAVFYLAGIWTCMTLSMSVVLTNSRKVMLTTLCLGAVLLFLYLILPGFQGVPEFIGFVRVMRVVTSVLLIGGLVLSEWVFYTSLDKGLVKARKLVTSAVVWAPIAVIVSAALWIRMPKPVVWPEVLLLGAAALVVIPLMPLAAAPLALHNSRHLR